MARLHTIMFLGHGSMSQRTCCSGLVALSLLLLWPLNTLAEWYQQEAAIMGTSINVELWHDDAEQGRALTQSVMDEMQRIDDLMSTYKPTSELSYINAHAADGPVAVSTELLSLIIRALDYSVITDGAFDITYASAGQYYDYRKGKKPTDLQLEEALPAINYRHVKIDPQRSTIEFLQDGVRIDLGGIAKGYAVDRSMEILRLAGVENAIVSAGGDSRVIGKHLDRPWNVGIRNPRDRHSIVSMIPLENAAISTSGDYERYFEEDGIRYHHILNPGTGKSPHEVYSSSIIGSVATDTDALSTSVFVLGVQRGLQLINTLPDTEAVIIDNQGQMHYSAGLARIQ
ncbi:MAG: FAD:protein FMN transferase [Gammaproteobacteria bacterium]|jgi:thiamine biosynthesis lipoprotein|nr:FAD:protein FMN transferase [Gammaproteobacteria bacterium]